MPQLISVDVTPSIASVYLAFQRVETCLGSWASDSGSYNALLREVFGKESTSAANAKALLAQLRGTGLGISVEILGGAILSGNKGAYINAAPEGGERIYLNNDWLQSATPEQIEAVLLEEIGHAIDIRLNGQSDSPGDEGEVFSSLIRGINPNPAATTENDQSLITINGHTVAIEASADTTAPTGSLGSYATTPAYSAATTNPFGITNVGGGGYANPALADIDRDGDLDLFIGNLDGNTLLFTNTASSGATAPAYSAAITNPFGITNVGQCSSLTFGDIDADGDLDLFIGNHGSYTLLFRNTASSAAIAPAYSAPSTNPFGIKFAGYRVNPSLVDIDGDGDLDLIIGNMDGNTLLFTNTASSGATVPAYSAAATNPFGLTDVGSFASPTFADIDGDGDLDLFIGVGYGNTLLFTNTASSGATVPAYSPAITNPFGISDVSYYANPTLADIDGDGDLDLFIGNHYGDTLLFRNTAATPVAPVVSTTANGSYGIGSVITITVGFSEAVLVTGSPQLQLETGSTDRYATYSSGTGSNTLSFQYTVQAGDSSADLDQLSSSALTLNGGTIKDAAGNNAILTLAAPGATGSLAANAALVIDTAPSGNSNLRYPIFSTGSQSPFGLIKTSAGFGSVSLVDIDGDGDLDVFSGSTDGEILFYKNTSATSTPAFAAETKNPFGILSINGGGDSKPTLADIDGDLDFDLITGGSGGPITIQLNTGTRTNPVFGSASINPYGITSTSGYAIPTLVDSDGDGDLDLFVGNNLGNVLFFRNSGSRAAPSYEAAITNPFGISDVGDRSAPTFADVDLDSDLDLLVGRSDGNILYFENTKNASGDPAYRSPTFLRSANNTGDASPALADFTGDGTLDLLVSNGTKFYLNTGIGSASLIPVTSSTTNGSYGPGAVITLTLQFSEVVFVTGLPRLQLETGVDDKYATYSGGSSSANLSFQYTVAAGDISLDLDQLSSSALTLNSGTIRDAAGNNALLELAEPGSTGSLASNAQIIIDTVAPAGTLALAGSSTAPAYRAATTDPFGITNVGSAASPTFADIDADGDLDLFIGNRDGNTLLFTNTASSGATTPAYRAATTNPFGIADVGSFASPTFADIDADGDLDLFIGNRDGNTLLFTNTGSATAPAYSAATTDPFGIGDVGFYASPALADIDGDGDLDLFIGDLLGNTLLFTNTASSGATAPAYSAPSTNPFGITDVGDYANPTLADIDGDGDLDLFIGNRDGNTLLFTNTASSGATTPAYRAATTNPYGITNVRLHASPTLADIDRDGDLDLFIGNSDGNTLLFTNTAVTYVAPVAATTTNGTYGIGSVVTITVGFSEAVLVDTTGGTPQLQLETGSTDRYATYSSGTGSNTLSFQYTVQAGDTSADLDQLSSSALTLNGGTIKDAAGNNAILTLAAPGATGSLAANAALVIDGTAPTANLTSITDDVGSVTGLLASSARTDDSSLVLAGTNESGSSVAIYNGSTLLGNATVSGTNWTYTATIANATTYDFNVKETDSAGNTSAATSNLTVTGDTVAPTANITSITDDVGSVTGLLASGARTDDSSLVLAGTNESGSSVAIYNGSTLLGNATVSGTNWTYTATIANATTYDFNVKETDSAGNTSAATSNFTITGDTVAPTANITSITDDVGSVTGLLASGARTDDSSLVLAGTNESGSSVAIYNGSTLLGNATVSGTNWTYTATIANATTYNFNVKETDSAGNTSAATSNFTITGDTVAPTANITSITDNIGSITGALASGARTDDSSLVLAGTNESGSSVAIYNGSTLLGNATVTATNWTYTATIANATTYNFNVKETDSAGNTSAATSNFTITGDTVAPTANITSITDNIGSITGALASGARTDDSSLVLTGTNELGSSVAIYNGNTLLGNATVTATNWIYTATIANATTYDFNVKETDSAGNTSAATSNFTITGDTTAPTGSLGSYATTPAYSAAVTNPYGITNVGSIARHAFADIDGDGDLDLFIGNQDGNTLIFTNTAASGSTTPAYSAAVTNPYGITDVGDHSSPALTDFDGDGDLDLFIGNKDGNTLIFTNTAASGSTTPAYSAALTNPYGITNVGNFSSPAFADIDSDGDLDLFIGNKDGNTLLFRNTAASGATTPVYIAASTNPFGIADVGDFASPTLADIDGDGDLDLFIGKFAGNTLLFTNSAASGASTPAYSAAVTNPFFITDVGYFVSPTFADIDRDGDLDLFIGNNSGNTLLFRNNATAPVAPVVSTTTNGSYGIGSVITITVGFSEAVLVTGSPQLQLETGSTDRYAIYSSGTGSNTLSFQYTVQAGDSSADLDQLSSSALTLNGGTIKDAAGNNAILILANPGATGSLAANAQLVIDVTAPTANFTSITDNVGSITGLLAPGARTDDSNLVLAGTNESGSSVAIYNGITLLGNATVTATNWIYTATIANATTYNFNVKETDSAGNTSAATNNFTVTGDTTAPTANITSITDNVGSITGALASVARTDDTSLVLAGTNESGSSVAIYNGNTLLGNATVTATNWIYTATIANATTYDFNVKETDSAGNTSAATSNFTITGDTVAPTGSQASSGATTPAYRAAVTNPYGITNVGSIARHAFVDIDGDGDLDLFIGNQDGNTQIFTNTAASGSTTPAYSAAVTNPYGITEVGDHSSPALTDFDGDGDLDLFIGNKDGNTLIFTNTAASGSTTPAYSAAVTNPYGITNVGNFSSPAFADIDSDGDLDLFIGNKDGNTLLFTNTAASGSTTPAYSAAVTNPYGITDVGNYSSPALADLDGDGDLDLFIGNYDGNTLLFTNTAASGATTPAYSAAVTNPFFITDVGYFASPTFADIDRDGDLDLFIGNNSGNTLLGNNSGNTLLFRNTATTTPLAPVVSTTTNGSYGIGSVVTITVGFSEAVFVTGIPQLQLETGSTGRYATYSSGSGINTLSFQYTVQAGDSSADLDQLSSSALTLNGGTIKDAAGNDAVLTLASPGATGSLAANAALVIDTTAPTGSLGSYATTLAYSAAVTNPYGITDVGYFASPTLADIDRDGDLDLFIGNRDGNTLLFTNTAASGATTPAYSAASPNPFGIGDVGSYASPTLADIDRDGDLDLFIGNSDGNTLLFTNTAASGATTPAYSAAVTNPYGITDVGDHSSPTLADIDGDGDLDLFIGNSDGNTLLFTNTAASGATTPAYSAASTNPFGIDDVGYNASPTLADIDRDGDLDLFIGNSDGNTLLFTNTAALGATTPAYSAAITNPYGITDVGFLASPALADIDRDGDLDLFIGNFDGNTLLFRNTAATTPVAPVVSTTTNGSYGIGSVITITVGFSEAVFVTGIPQLQLETGSTDRYATYSSGSGTNILSFQYTVQAGDSSADLDQLSSSALTLNGGTIKDAAGNDAVLTLANPGATGSLAANAALVIDVSAPTAQDLPYTGSTGQISLARLTTTSGTFTGDVSLNPLVTAPSYANQNVNLSIGKTGLNFSLNLFPASTSKFAKLQFPLAPLLDGFTTTNKRLAYFVYDSPVVGAAPVATPFTYDPIKKAGARFYDLDGNGSADTADLQFVDGGYGDKDGVKNGVVVDPSTAGVVSLNAIFTATATATALTVGDPTDSTSPAALTVRATLTAKAASVNQIGYVALNADEKFDTLTYELVRDRGTILLANLESSDTPNVTGMKFQRDINLINGQKLVFFEVVDTTLESLLAKNTSLQGFGSSFRTLDLSKSTDTAATASKGGNTVALSLLNESAIAGLGDLISSQMADTPILDFTGLQGRTLEDSTVSLAREANYDTTIGFYRIQRADGAVLDPVTNTLITPGSAGYKAAALSSTNLFSGFGTLAVANGATRTETIAAFNEYGLLAPYATVAQTGDTFFSFRSANSDNLNHFRVLGSGVIGLEDLNGGGDQDFDDNIVSFNFKLKGTVA